ncbi:RDD family protein [Pontibacter ruber]|uniref:RDD family protein n=1 Tax=Pontibacter ruber TaxID=1343895 RepID=A0ABW5CUU4_9BACT|nr:RDD family protein [Pontibacter ruber]
MQYSAPQTESKAHLADFGTRIVAFALDILLLASIIGVMEYFTISSDETAMLLKPERLLQFLLGWLYFAGLESSIWQTTAGKHLLGLRVTSTLGKRISFKCASIRYFAKVISVFVFIMRMLSSSPLTFKETFHDKLAHTQVVKV